MKMEQSLGQQKASMLGEQEHPSPTLATAIKYQATSGKSMMIAVAYADANVFIKKRCPTSLVNGMSRKMPAFPGLNPVAENIFMLQTKGSELIACATLKALQHLAHLPH